MLPAVDRWEIIYADGSRFTSSDGSWAEAPGFGIFAVVYYRVDGTRLVDMQQHDESRYVMVEGCTHASGGPVKFGLWVDNEQYFKLFDSVHGEVVPR